jgi:hypothetical protein
VWHLKEPPLPKAVRANHKSKFAALSPVMIAEKLLVWLKTIKQTVEGLQYKIAKLTMCKT